MEGVFTAEGSASTWLTGHGREEIGVEIVKVEGLSQRVL